MPVDKVDVCRTKDENDFDPSSYVVMVHPRKLLREENLGKPCEREEKNAEQLDLNVYNSNIEEKTCEEHILPGRKNGIDLDSQMNASYLNC